MKEVVPSFLKLLIPFPEAQYCLTRAEIPFRGSKVLMIAFQLVELFWDLGSSWQK